MEKYVIGIDEVGRGCLAGPLVVAALAMPRGYQASGARSRGGKTLKLKDSKKLSAVQREAWVEYFGNHKKISWVLARVTPATIDKLNVARAANRAALAALRKFFALHASPAALGGVYLDGGLYLGNDGRGFTKIERGVVRKEFLFRQGSSTRRRGWAFTVVKGDEKIRAVAAASIVAKVHRDRAMARLAKKYPAYGFEIHKGYGTRRHREALAAHGPCAAHRLTFLKRYHRISR